MFSKSKTKKIIGALSLFAATAAVAGVGAMATSCATVDTKIFRSVTADDVAQQKDYDALPTISEATVKNLVYGTKDYNGGNYVLVVATYSNVEHWRFLHGTSGPSNPLRWAGDFGNAVETVSGTNSPINNPNLYPNGIKFALYADTFSSENNTDNKNNPFAKYRKVDSDSQIATQQQKDNSEKYRRNDDQAVKYRDVANLIYKTYSSETNVNNWINTSSETPTNNPSDGTIPSPDTDKYGNITQIMVIAYRKNKDGKIDRSYYVHGASDPGQSGDTEGGGEDDTTGGGSNTGDNNGTGGNGSDNGTGGTGDGTGTGGTGTGGTGTGGAGTGGSGGTNGGGSSGPTGNTVTPTSMRAHANRLLPRATVSKPSSEFLTFLSNFYNVNE